MVVEYKFHHILRKPYPPFPIPTESRPGYIVFLESRSRADGWPVVERQVWKKVIRTEHHTTHGAS